MASGRAGAAASFALAMALAIPAPGAAEPSQGSPIPTVYPAATAVFGHRAGEPPGASIVKLMLVRTTQLAVLDTALEIARNPRCAGTESYAECAELETYHSLLFEAVGLVQACPPRQRPERLIACLIEGNVALTAVADSLSGQAAIAVTRLRSALYQALWRAWMDGGQPPWTAWPNLAPAIPLAEAEQLHVLRGAVEISALEAVADLLDRIDREIDAEEGELAMLETYASAIAASAAALKRSHRPGFLGARQRIAADGDRAFPWYRHLEDWLSAARQGIIPSLEQPARAPAPAPAPATAAGVPSAPSSGVDPMPGGNSGTPQRPGRETPTIWNEGGQPVHIRPDDKRGDFLDPAPSSGPKATPPQAPAGTEWPNAAPPGLGGPNPRDRPPPTIGHPGFGPPGPPRDGEPPNWLEGDPPGEAGGTSASPPSEGTRIDGGNISALTAVAAELVTEKISKEMGPRWSPGIAGWTTFFAGLELSGTMDRFWRDTRRTLRHEWMRTRADRTRREFLEGMQSDTSRSASKGPAGPAPGAGDNEPEAPPPDPEPRAEAPKIQQWLRKLLLGTAGFIGNSEEEDPCRLAGCRSAGGGIRG